MTTTEDIPGNPHLVKLMQAGAYNAFTFRGYIGPGAAEGRIVLYPSLDDLSQSVEFSKSDVLGFADLPESVMPLGAKIIWVKGDATIVRRGLTTPQRTIADKQPDVREAGRLRMQLRRFRAGPVGVCHSLCAICQSNCLGICQSTPR
jgi:hypothetical protein